MYHSNRIGAIAPERFAVNLVMLPPEAIRKIGFLREETAFLPLNDFLSSFLFSQKESDN